MKSAVKNLGISVAVWGMILAFSFSLPAQETKKEAEDKPGMQTEHTLQENPRSRAR